jgi:hypothetical protein
LTVCNFLDAGGGPAPLFAVWLVMILPQHGAKFQAQSPATFFAIYDSIAAQGIYSLGRVAVKRKLSILVLALCPVLLAASQQAASAAQTVKQASAKTGPSQKSNAASSHDRHHRRHHSGKRHHRHHKAANTR